MTAVQQKMAIDCCSPKIKSNTNNSLPLEAKDLKCCEAAASGSGAWDAKTGAGTARRPPGDENYVCYRLVHVKNNHKHTSGKKDMHL